MSSVTMPSQRPASLGERRRAARERLHLKRPHDEGRIAQWFERRSGETVTTPLGPPPAAYYVIGSVVLAFVLLGLVMVLSSSAANAVGGEESPYRVFSRQMVWASLGGLALLAALKIPYVRWRPLATPMFVIASLSMFLPFAPGIGVTINGTRAWVHIGSLSFQPSEFLKLAALIYVADLLTRRRDELTDVHRSLYPVAAIAGGGAAACLVQGDFGSAVVLASIIVITGFIAGLPVRQLMTLTVAGAGVLVLFVLSSPRRLDRFTAFLDLRGNREHTSYQIYQGFLSMANGGLTGSGIGGSNGKLGYLPLAHSDFIFAIIADELGLIGSLGVIGGFLLIVWFGVQVALAAPDRFGMLLAGGIAAWMGVQALVNLGGVTGLMPVTGLTLPFFSAGGTSLFVMMAASGILLNIARRAA